MEILKNKRVIFIGGYLHGVQDIVKSIYRHLTKIHPNVLEINTDMYPQILIGKYHSNRGALGPVYIDVKGLSQLTTGFNNTDIIVCCAGGLTFSIEDIVALKKVFPGLRTLGISLSDPEVFFQTTGRICWNFDYFTTNDYPSYQRYLDLGYANIFFMHFGSDPDLFRYKQVVSKYSCDVAFFGSYKPYRYPYIKMLQENFNLKVYGSGWEQVNINAEYVSGEDYVDAINSAKILLDLPQTTIGYKEIKDRILIYGACCKFVITEYIPHYDKLHLHFNWQLIGFRDLEDLKEKVTYYLGRPNQRQEFADRLQSACVHQLSWTVLLRNLFEELSRREGLCNQ